MSNVHTLQNIKQREIDEEMQRQTLSQQEQLEEIRQQKDKQYKKSKDAKQQQNTLPEVVSDSSDSRNDSHQQIPQSHNQTQLNISGIKMRQGAKVNVRNKLTSEIHHSGSGSVSDGSSTTINGIDMEKDAAIDANDFVEQIYNGESSKWKILKEASDSDSSGERGNKKSSSRKKNKNKPKDEKKVYTFEKPGSVLIINNKFDSKNDEREVYKQHRREGAEKDANDMKKLFQCVLGCDVTVKKNVPSNELPGIITFFQDSCCEESDFSVVIFMSHGSSNNTLLMDDLKTINLYKDLVYPFKHEKFPAFQGKPKIFLIQACDSGSRSLEDDCSIEDDGEPSASSGKKPVSREIADTFIGKPCLPFRKSWRNRDVGSWYMQAVDKVLREHWRSKDLETMHTMIEDQVIQFGNEMSDEHSRDVVQTPSVHNISFGRFKFPEF